jgi:hypothetical protein
MLIKKNVDTEGSGKNFEVVEKKLLKDEGNTVYSFIVE